VCCLHTLVVPGQPKTQCVQLSTGSREHVPAVHDNLDSRLWAFPLPIQGEGEPISPNSHWCLPQMIFNPTEGRIRLEHVIPAWDDFTPLADNEPILKGCKLEDADCQSYTLAALFTNPRTPAQPPLLRLFRGPRGIPLMFLEHKHPAGRFTLSANGRFLARDIGRGQVENRDALLWKVPRHITAIGRFHPQIQVELGECWLSIRIDRTVHLVRWHEGTLVLRTGQWYLGFVKAELARAGLPSDGIAARSGRLPGFLPSDPGHRFSAAAWNNLIAVVDRFGEVALFEPMGELVCMFFAFRSHLAVWMPDGTCHGPASLLNRPPTSNALTKIGAALRSAWERGERTVV
jgi:hypothetical protein